MPENSIPILPYYAIDRMYEMYAEIRKSSIEDLEAIKSFEAANPRYGSIARQYYGLIRDEVKYRVAGRVDGLFDRLVPEGDFPLVSTLERGQWVEHGGKKWMYSRLGAMTPPIAHVLVGLDGMMCIVDEKFRAHLIDSPLTEP